MGLLRQAFVGDVGLRNTEKILYRIIKDGVDVRNVDIVGRIFFLSDIQSPKMASAHQELESSHHEALLQMRSWFSELDGHGMALDDACLLRYLRARQFDTAKASAMLHATLEWRKEVNVPKIVGEDLHIIKTENSTGKVYVRGEDKQGRLIMIMKPAQENTFDHDNQIKHLIYQMERARTVLQRRTEGTGKLCMIIDYNGFSLRNAPSMKTTYATLNIVQNHYPELLGASYMLNPPFIFTGIWKVVYPLIDSVTRQKFIFLRNDIKTPANQLILQSNFNMDALEVSLGGKNPVQFNSEVYLKAELDACFEEALRKASTAIDVEG